MPDLFPTAPRRSRRKLMHVSDAGGDSSPIVQYRCARCGHETDWQDQGTLTEAKKGKPCPNCNKE